MVCLLKKRVLEVWGEEDALLERVPQKKMMKKMKVFENNKKK